MQAGASFNVDDLKQKIEEAAEAARANAPPSPGAA
jgi:hypothetical protein